MSLETRTYVNQFMVAVDQTSDRPKEAVTELILMIEANKLSLLDFIKNMGDFLTEESENVRSRSLLLLSSVLSQIDKNQLMVQDIKVLLAFYTSKLDDVKCTKEILLGIDALIKMVRFPSDELDNLLVQITNKYHPTDQLASTRCVAFDILRDLLSKFEDHLVACLNDQFIDAFVNITTNEKDPKNLMSSFQLNKSISMKFDIGAKEEDMFDCIFCYFPISFKAPDNNPYEITGDQLKKALRDCMSSNSVYAKEAFPNLVEKMASTSPSVKMDVLMTIKQCIENYTASTVEEYWISLWNSLKFEILHRELASADNIHDMFKYYENAESEDERTVAVTLQIFESFSRKFVDTGMNSYRDYLILVFDSLKEYLSDPESTKLKQATVIISVMCGANLNTYNLLVPKTMEAFLAPLKKDDISIKDQRALLRNVPFMLDSYHQLFNERGLAIQPTNCMFRFKDDIHTLLSRALLSTSTLEVTLRCLAIKLVLKLFKLKGFLEPEECQLIAQSLTDVLLEDDNPQTFSQALDALTSIARDYPMIILEYTIPKLVILLPDSARESASHSLNTVDMSKEKVLDVLFIISDNRLIINSVVIRLLNKLEAVLKRKDDIAEEYYAKLLLFSLSKILEKLTYADSTNEYLKKFIPRFLSLVLPALVIDQESCLYKDSIAAEYIGRILKEVVAKCDGSFHQQLFNDAFKLFVEGKCTDNDNSLLHTPLSECINIEDSRYATSFIVFTGICSTVDYRTVIFPVDPGDFVDSSIEILHREKLNLVERQAVLQTISLVVNKWFKKEQKEYLQKKSEKLEAETEGSSSTASIATALEVYAWLTKGLLLKNDEMSEEFVQHLIRLLENGGTVSHLVSRCFEILVADADGFTMYKRPGAFGKLVVLNVNVRTFYKQKFVDSTLPVLIEKFRDSGSNRKEYLLTISLIIKYAEKQVIMPHLKEIMPVVMTALTQKSSLIISSALSILEIAIEEAGELVREHLSEIIPRLLQIIKQQGSGKGAEVKIKAFECLMGVSKYEIHLLQPFKKEIIKESLVGLDDDKRSVRKLACNCRQVYYELGESEE
ncbi:hypothetical protein FOA43_004532 [Brettanomyces nanus]|uniref:MMS19 nucleotide excision repair protein n=1 Tax=Eeniella nana TaxID=13502 RepID=A0A875S872_EENNA|nr:uncharacterized protein FOA43_004532 [Brettanomyces nanus]QPG77128.1 hypothetical protein FOA43_004532 [Brettanomyces nanus]